MKLFLAAEAGDPATIEKLQQYTGGLKNKSIAYIPTASNGENEFGGWKKNSETYKVLQTLCDRLTPVQLEDYKSSTVIKELMNKDILWFSGGFGGYLMYWVRQCEVDKAIPELLEKSIYVGSSAGSWITAKDLNVAEWFIGAPEPGAKFIPGLGLVEFDIYPHYEESFSPEIKCLYKGKNMYLLKNGEEILVEDGKISVQGEERIITN
jgi:peptidase E